MADDLHGRLALVTGSAQGLGRVIAFQLAAAGCRVLINCAHSAAKAEAVAAEIAAAGGDAGVLVCDITSEAELAEKVTPLPIDILVNNARKDPYARPDGMGEGDWFNTLLNVNLTGAWLTTLAVVEGMKSRKWGRILNVSSVQAYVGVPRKLIPYSVSKAGMMAMSRCFAKELGGYGITVNTLAPGMVLTENLSNRLSQEEIDAKLNSFPLHRAATSEEVAECAVNAIRAGAMTGEVININSGLYFPA